MSFSTMEQLRSKTWPTKEAALKDLRANGFKVRGADYEVRETSPGVWQIMDFETANNDNGAAAEKPASRKPSRKAAASPAQSQTEFTAETLGPPDVAAEIAQELAADPKLEPAASPLFPEETFELVLGERLTADMTAAMAQAIARKASIVVHVRATSGEVTSVVEPPPPTQGRGTTTRQDIPLTELAKTCIALAKRRGGAKRTELTALNGGVVINWKGYLDRVGKREGLSLSVDKSGPTPVYFLK